MALRTARLRPGGRPDRRRVRQTGGFAGLVVLIALGIALPIGLAGCGAIEAYRSTAGSAKNDPDPRPAPPRQRPGRRVLHAPPSPGPAWALRPRPAPARPAFPRPRAVPGPPPAAGASPRRPPAPPVPVLAPAAPPPSVAKTEPKRSP